MSRDYANRKPKSAAKAGKGARSSKRNTSSSNMPLIPWLLAIVLVSGFGYFLWTIKGSSEDVAPAINTATKSTATDKQATKPAVAKKDPNALPPKPQEEWTYLEELENKSVDVDVPNSGVVSSGLYQMQCGSFRQESQANEMKARIAFMGMEALVKRSEGTNGVWYRVVLGPFESKRDGERGRHKMQKAGINTCQIWLWQ
ncbi:MULTISPECIES: SPOR domain-containing protein [Shewanella]|uniref:SPOR domain-containing protein n=1 Tax=Shewanella holmiensis TaxID=2952222 RepID=A0A9X2WQL0_9GAMM|nr:MULTISPECIES: SPOR domain-containing protein [Shewanella]MCT7943708.1 SPOR domain-containing protein [Shewanella holmiensis]MDP5147723.1 SPOR domain-containing protein [Shewanella sp. ULN5]